MDGELVFKVSYIAFFKNTRVITIIITYVFAGMGVFFLDPILPLRINSLGGSDNTIALFFALISLSFVIGSIVSGVIAAKNNKILIVLLFVFLQTVGLVALSGIIVPRSILLVLTAFSVSLVGFAEGCLTVPVISIILDTMER